MRFVLPGPGLIFGILFSPVRTDPTAALDGAFRSSYNLVMLKRSRKRRPTDPNQLAASIVSDATRDPHVQQKNPAAVALGRLGGLKGGPARAASLSAAKRRRIAKKAAESRWNPPK